MSVRASVRSTGLGQLLLLGVIWGVTFPVARVGVEGGADPIVLVALDLLLATAVMATVARVVRGRRPAAKSLLQSAGLGALLIAGINLPLYWGLRGATGGSASIVYATSPIISLLVLWIMGSPAGIHRREGMALALGLGGVVLLGFATTGSSLVAGIAALAAFGLGAACQGTGAVLVGRARPQGEDVWGRTFQFLGGCIAAALAVPLVSRHPSLPLNAATVGSIAYVGILSMVIGYTLFFGMIRRFGAVRANQVTFLNPVVALLVGVLAFGEGFEPLEAAALACILLALALLQPTAPRPSPARAAAPSGETETAGVASREGAARKPATTLPAPPSSRPEPR